MSERHIRCPHCRGAVIAISRKGPNGSWHHAPAANVQTMMSPTARNVVLLVCPNKQCGKVAEWAGKRILIIDT